MMYKGVHICRIAKTMYFWSVLVLLTSFYSITGGDSFESNDQSSASARTMNADSDNIRQEFTWDPNGYVFFCLCMGRFGNQADHFLGGLAFAKSINRTLVLPPFRTYRNVMFTEWFKEDVVAQYHRVIKAENFMAHLADTHWPKGRRAGFCWLPPNSKQKCVMKEGNPFGPFWDGLNVDFDDYVVYHLSYYESDDEAWKIQYPADKYPVLAMRGAPAAFPIRPSHRHLQRYLVFADKIDDDANKYIDENFPDKKFIGVHLRNGPDWINACQKTEGTQGLMASPQCLGDTGQLLTYNMCYPSKQEVLRLIKNVVMETRAKVVFVATDKDPMIKEITEHLKNWKVEVYHKDPWLPIDDLAILIKSDHFIGNCVSSFTAYAKRVRDIEGKPTSFWGFS